MPKQNVTQVFEKEGCGNNVGNLEISDGLTRPRKMYGR